MSCSKHGKVACNRFWSRFVLCCQHTQLACNTQYSVYQRPPQPLLLDPNTTALVRWARGLTRELTTCRLVSPTQRSTRRIQRRQCRGGCCVVRAAAAVGTKTLKIGTRGSPLALAQAYLTRQLLQVSAMDALLPSVRCCCCCCGCSRDQQGLSAQQASQLRALQQDPLLSRQRSMHCFLLLGAVLH
jgi:hypothetical protein